MASSNGKRALNQATELSNLVQFTDKDCTMSRNSNSLGRKYSHSKWLSLLSYFTVLLSCSQNVTLFLDAAFANSIPALYGQNRRQIKSLFVGLYHPPLQKHSISHHRAGKQDKRPAFGALHSAECTQRSLRSHCFSVTFKFTPGELCLLLPFTSMFTSQCREQGHYFFSW